MKPPTIRLIIFLVCNAVTFSSFAAINIQADKADYNYKTKVDTYIGHVKITENNPETITQLTGDKIMISHALDQKIQSIIAVGNLAHYDTLPKDNQHSMHAEARRIEIYTALQKMLLIGKGKMQQDNNSFAGPRLEYFIKKQAILAFPSKENQTTIVIQPQQHG